MDGINVRASKITGLLLLVGASIQCVVILYLEETRDMAFGAMLGAPLYVRGGSTWTLDWGRLLPWLFLGFALVVLSRQRAMRASRLRRAGLLLSIVGITVVLMVSVFFMLAWNDPCAPGLLCDEGWRFGFGVLDAGKAVGYAATVCAGVGLIVFGAAKPRGRSYTLLDGLFALLGVLTFYYLGVVGDWIAVPAWYEGVSFGTDIVAFLWGFGWLAVAFETLLGEREALGLATT